jgi:two-component sensor histidine kinase
MARGADLEVLARIEATFAGNAAGGSEISYRRRDGSLFWSAILISPVRDESGDIVQHFASFVDLTDQAGASPVQHAHRRAESSRQNTLATVQSIVWQALRNTSDPTVTPSSRARPLPVARPVDPWNWEGAGLLDLVKAALEPFELQMDGRSTCQHGAAIRVLRKAARLGIAFHELATNAVKYGAFSNKAGSVLIDWTIEPAPQGDRLLLRWQEKGGPPVKPPSRKGFGSQVIERGLAHELEGTAHLDYRSDGVVCTINFPAPPGARDD